MPVTHRHTLTLPTTVVAPHLRDLGRAGRLLSGRVGEPPERFDVPPELSASALRKVT